MARQSFGGLALITYPIDGGDVSSAPTTKIPASSMQHTYLKETDFGYKLADTPSGTVERFVHMANGAEVIQGFYCGCVDTGTSSSMTFDLLKNGSSILAAAVTVANTDPDRTKKSGTVTSVTLADNDILTIKLITYSATGVSGPFAQVSVVAAQQPS